MAGVSRRFRWLRYIADLSPSAAHATGELGCCVSPRVYWDHGLTVRRVTVHDGDMNYDYDYEYDYDSSEEGNVSWSDQSGFLFRDLRSSYVGMSGSPSRLVGAFYTALLFLYSQLEHLL